MERISYQKTARWKYRLSADYSIRLPELAARNLWTPPPLFSSPFFTFLPTKLTLTIRAGYSWDGASGPTKDTRDSMRGSMVHDALYQAIREGLLDEEYRKQADEILWRILREDGMNPVRAQFWYVAVRKFAPMFGALSKLDPTIYTAP